MPSLTVIVRRSGHRARLPQRLFGAAREPIEPGIARVIVLCALAIPTIALPKVAGP